MRNFNRYMLAASIGIPALFAVVRGATATPADEQTKPELERRVAKLEDEVSKLKERLDAIAPAQARRSRPAMVAAAKADIAGLEIALDTFEIDVGRYPTSEEGIEALVKQPASVKGWRGPYIKRMPTDPWGQPYVYRYPGEHNKDGFDLASNGPDGRTGGADDLDNRSEK